MIDFVRLRYTNKQNIESFVCDRKNFDKLHTVLEYHTGEIEYPFTAKIGCMDIRITDKTAYVKNSIHKLYNELNGEEAHNHNDFSYSALCETISDLDTKLIDLRKTRLTQLEFGLNIKLPVPAENIIKHNIVLHKLKLHSHYEKFNGKGEYKQFDYSNYYLKIYDKAKHFKLTENIIRIELKYKNSKGFNALGIHNIHDLKSKVLLQNLFNDLLKRFDELTIVDDIPHDSKMTSKEKNKLNTYLSYNYWNKYADRLIRNNKSKDKIAFESLLIKHDLLKTKQFLRISLIEKFNELLNN
jgi:hypothetical protein